MDAITYSTFRQGLKGYMKQINDDSVPMIITNKDSKDDVVVIGKRDYDAMLETIHVMSNPYLAEKIDKGEQQYLAGNVSQHTLLEDD
ncbi:type II toxin-antitoxin system Phd/YefM family antitoxin [Furfurilactobacillus milii]|uniref:Antitoxin n=1 Tax=Furfurilactobacillus milii TaxID=2888272 RepID=A0ABT6D9Y7_9LACO|nr:type II toxin-antitoxin system Phd/YefM family antitoxin [Furfurilactobacillus milii]QLE65455.1 Prevent-host-death protein [Furfurilactobacillus rossiae]MCF6160953.1 type II toxin-antitoxin system Phd/YefM family antitoxin [Furfurilactobacillus milii]MCF6163281.1 type II toxin-antitoxin system Phd/YefM family antitoxin [Furfurilactobacillus milii]MDF9913936.1 type II toxin-antitoxin system Phd/YefM family antitoxin [Furfurilactobacillus milii]QLE67884.1 Prevent-host-death family protein [Fu